VGRKKLTRDITMTGDCMRSAICSKTPTAMTSQRLLRAQLPKSCSVCTDRERDVLRLLASGLTNAAIANRWHGAMGLSVLNKFWQKGVFRRQIELTIALIIDHDVDAGCVIAKTLHRYKVTRAVPTH
jgi:hypothetical protein